MILFYYRQNVWFLECGNIDNCRLLQAFLQKVQHYYQYVNYSDFTKFFPHVFAHLIKQSFTLSWTCESEEDEVPWYETRPCLKLTNVLRYVILFILQRHYNAACVIQVFFVNYSCVLNPSDILSSLIWKYISFLKLK